MTRLGPWKKSCTIFLLSAATAIFAPAQVFTTLVSFNGTDGADPLYMSPIQGADGAVYGTTEIGGSKNDCSRSGCGTAFKITSQGTLTGLSFASPNGLLPWAGLLLATDGTFYGTTEFGGDGVGPCTNEGFPGCGTIFRVTPSGTLTTLYSFCEQTGCPDGAVPFATLIQAADDSFYGTTFSGGANGYGTIFTITPGGKLTTLYNFCSQTNCADGEEAHSGLVQSTDGSFYGTTAGGGTAGWGTIFNITSTGKFTNLLSFDLTNGAQPWAGLIQATDGSFYGTTFLGGDVTCGPPYGCGTVFKVTSSGTLTTLYSFEGTDGAGPTASLAQATDGNFYGATTGVENRTVFSDGTIFKISPQGALTTLHSFNNTDGAEPLGGLLQATDGSFYGTTGLGGNLTCAGHQGCGTVYNLNVGLGPFVTFVHAAGKIGQTGGILGQGFKGTTAVSFNGTPASFTVKSKTLLDVTVPPGATTGYVTVTTRSGTLTSNVPFHVIP